MQGFYIDALNPVLRKLYHFASADRWVLNSYLATMFWQRMRLIKKKRERIQRETQECFISRFLVQIQVILIATGCMMYIME